MLDLLNDLSDLDKRSCCQILASNEDTPVAVLQRLVFTEEPITVFLAENPNTPLDILVEYIEDDSIDLEFQKLAAKNIIENWQTNFNPPLPLGRVVLKLAQNKLDEQP